MKIEDLLVYGKSKVHSDIAKILLGEIINKNPLELLNHLEEVVEEDKCQIYKDAIEAYTEGKPLQYILGKVNFYGNEFYVNKNVLIPRFETEELVENTIKYINKYFTEPVDIVDLGCGTGVIGLSLEKKVSTKTVDLIDISKEALEVTNKNCGKLNSKAIIINNDFLFGIDKKYDVIISNPPYIAENEEIEDIVKNNEPHLALYAGEEGLDCYEAILKDINKNLKEKTLIAFEIGANQAGKIKDIIKKYLGEVKIEVKKDLSDRDRMIFIFYGIDTP